jgi:inner membrane protein
MRLEDYALLVGALSSFIAIALVMYFTRRVDWYGATRTIAALTPAPSEDPA